MTLGYSHLFCLQKYVLYFITSFNLEEILLDSFIFAASRYTVSKTISNIFVRRIEEKKFYQKHGV